METLQINDFSAGWVPSDDPINGRKNGLLKMNALELDSNGALTLTNGTKNWRSTNYPADAHTIYSKFISGVRKQYVSGTDGVIYRDATSIITGGSTTRTAFYAAFDYVFIWSDTQRYRDDGTTLTLIGIPAPLAPAIVPILAGPLNGDYEYAQMNVYNSGGAYKAQSVLSDPTATYTAIHGSFSVTPVAPSAPGNEVWIFRRGGNLDAWYRVKIVSTPYAAFIDALSDAEVLQLGVIANTELFQTNTTGIPEAILEAIPGINGRTLLFTNKSIYFTEVNSPDNYNPRYVIDVSASSSTTGTEMFLFARKVGENIILVGTTLDVYILSGTFRVLPDGYLDIYFRPLGVDFPPIGIDAAVYNRAVVYMAKEGWRMVGSDGSSFSLVSPNTDKLYRGTSVTFHAAALGYYNYDYGAIPTYIHPTLRYNCAITKDKLWCIVPVIPENNNETPTFTYRMEVYDFIRKYWRPMPFNWNAAGSYDFNELIGTPATWQVFPPQLVFAEDDGALLGFFKEYSTRNLREVDHPPYLTDGKLNNGAKQFVDFITLFNDNGSPHNSKTPLNLRVKCYTGGDDLYLTVWGTESKFQTPLTPGTIASKILTVNNAKFTEEIFDISSLGDVNGFSIQGAGQLSDFLLTDISIDYEPHPIKTKYIRLLSSYFGPQKKRPRVWPIVINTFGHDVTFTPIIDGINGTPSTINTSFKQTAFHHFTTDVFGIDFSGIFTAENYFELWAMSDPAFVQQLPLVKRFDQVGPEELFQYSKIKRFEVRLMAVGGTVMPYTIYGNDDIEIAGTFTVLDGKESSYFIDCPKTTSGEVIRLTLGPTEFDFYRYYIRLQQTRSGKDTEMEWIPLDNGDTQ